MSLREQAALDLLAITEDFDTGFGWAITVTNPAEISIDLTGLSTDIGQTIDPETGQAVSGRRASVTLPISRLTEASMGLPRNISSGSGKPWVITFRDIGGVSHTYKVCDSMPDRALGCITCLLEAYR